MFTLLFTLWLTPAWAFGLFTIDDVRRAIDAREVRSVDQVWRRLPFAMHAQPVLVHESLSPVAASARSPRLVLTDDDGALFAAASTSRRHPSYRRLELAAADPISGELSLYLVDFRQNPVLTRNPRECMGCHAVDGLVRLRVEPYPHWPGWFGHEDHMSEEPGFTLSASEQKAMIRFLRHQRHVPRLFRPFQDGFHFAEPAHQGALRLTVLAVRAEMRAAHHRFRAAPVYPRLRLALAASEAGEFKNLLDEDLRRDFEASEAGLDRELRENVVRYSARTNASFRRISGATWQRHVPALGYKSLIPFEWAFRKAGLSLAAFSTSGSPGVLNINTGIGSMVDYLRQFIADELAAEFGLGDRYVDRDAQFSALTLLPEPRRYLDDFVPAVRAKMCERALEWRIPGTTQRPQKR